MRGAQWTQEHHTSYQTEKKDEEKKQLQNNVAAYTKITQLNNPPVSCHWIIRTIELKRKLCVRFYNSLYAK